MEEVRTRRNFPAETWAVVRDAYLGGETAESISRRLKMSINTIRKRATRCGWTHKAHAAALARMDAETGSRAADTSEPAIALDRTARYAALLLTEGRAAEAQGLIRAAEGLRRLTQPTAGPGRRALTPQEMEAEAQARQAEASATHARVAERLNRLVEHLAHELLAQRPQGVPALYAPFVYAFRARHFGPQVEAADHAHAVAMGWPLDLWDADGRLKTGMARGPSGRVPAGTTPPSEGAGPEHCCAWTEQTEADARAGREADYGMAWETG